jgi:hypothetical protein
MGDDSPGNAIWEEIESNHFQKYEIHVVYSDKCKFIGEHEDTHLLSLSWGLSIYLFCEGLSQYMENSFMGQDLHDSARGIANNLYPMEFLCDNNNWKETKPAIIYPQSGSFVKFLIETYGKEKFKYLYMNTSRGFDLSKNLNSIKDSYNKDINQLESEWLIFLTNNKK